jgi:hypothetical protein
MNKFLLAKAAHCVRYYSAKISIGTLEEKSHTVAFLCQDNHVMWNEGGFDSVRVMKEYCREVKVAQLMWCQLHGMLLGQTRGMNLD